MDASEASQRGVRYFVVVFLNSGRAYSIIFRTCTSLNSKKGPLNQNVRGFSTRTLWLSFKYAQKKGLARVGLILMMSMFKHLFKKMM